MLPRALALGALAFASSGCVALPFAVPPTQLEVGTGYRDSGRGRDAPLELRAGLAPLGLDPSNMERKIDIVAGGLYETGKARTIEGAYLEAGGLLASSRISEATLDVARLSARMQLRMLTANDAHELGRGAALRLVGEVVGFADGPFGTFDKDGGAVGYGYGEGGIGFYTEGAYAEVAGTSIWQASAGLVVRLPLAAGIVFAWGWPKSKK